MAVVVSLFASVLSYYFGLETRQKTSYLLAEQLSITVEKIAATAAHANDPELAQEIVSGLAINPTIKSV